jgi:hypothetical protein
MAATHQIDAAFIRHNPAAVCRILNALRSDLRAIYVLVYGQNPA